MKFKVGEVVYYHAPESMYVERCVIRGINHADAVYYDLKSLRFGKMLYHKKENALFTDRRAAIARAKRNIENQYPNKNRQYYKLMRILSKV